MTTAAPAELPPFHAEAEAAVLGAILLDPGCFNEVATILTAPEAFYRLAHARIYGAMRELSARSQPIDEISVVEEMRKAGTLQDAGGPDSAREYLIELARAVPSSGGAARYAHIVRDRFIVREVLRTVGDVRAKAQEETVGTDELVELLERRAFEIAAKRYHGDVTQMQAVIQRVLMDMEEMRKFRSSRDPSYLPGLGSGWQVLDDYTTGWKPGELVVVGARPGQGKTSLALNIAQNVALSTHRRRDDGKGGVLFFSLEMSATEIVQRLLCSAAQVDLRRAKLGIFDEHEARKLKEAQGDLALSTFFIDDSFTLNMTEIRSKARRLKERHDIELIIVDYLQLVRDNDKLDRHLQIGNISRGLKALARELKIPVIAAAQLNRGVEQRGARDKRPMLADLRESGSIEQDADQVIMLYPQQSTEPGDAEANADNYKVTLIVAKNRGGPTGDVDMLFWRKQTRFAPPDHAHQFAVR